MNERIATSRFVDKYKNLQTNLSDVKSKVSKPELHLKVQPPSYLDYQFNHEGINCLFYL